MCLLSHLLYHHQGSISSPQSLMLTVKKDLARFLPSFGTTGRNSEAQALKAKLLITVKAGLSPAFLFCQLLIMLQCAAFSCCWFLHKGMENRRAFVLLMRLVRLPKLHILHGEETLRLWHGTLTTYGPNGVSLIGLTSKFNITSFFFFCSAEPIYSLGDTNPALMTFRNLYSLGPTLNSRKCHCPCAGPAVPRCYGKEIWLCPCTEEESAVEGCKFNRR